MDCRDKPDNDTLAFCQHFTQPSDVIPGFIPGIQSISQPIEKSSFHFFSIAAITFLQFMLIEHMSGKEIDVWLRMYEEQVRHARHHETLRSQATNFIVAVSAALLAFLAADNNLATADKTIVGMFIIIVNIYGLVMSLKHYELSRLHHHVGSKYRDEISQFAPVSDRHLNDVRAKAMNDHAKRFRFIRWIRAYAMWSGLHLVLALTGLLILIS